MSREGKKKKHTAERHTQLDMFKSSTLKLTCCSVHKHWRAFVQYPKADMFWLQDV